VAGRAVGRVGAATGLDLGLAEPRGVVEGRLGFGDVDGPVRLVGRVGLVGGFRGLGRFLGVVGFGGRFGVLGLLGRVGLVGGFRGLGRFLGVVGFGGRFGVLGLLGRFRLLGLLGLLGVLRLGRLRRGVRFDRLDHATLDRQRAQVGLVGRQLGGARRELVDLQDVGGDVGVGLVRQRSGRALRHRLAAHLEEGVDGVALPPVPEGVACEWRTDPAFEPIAVALGAVLDVLLFAAARLLQGEPAVRVLGGVQGDGGHVVGVGLRLTGAEGAVVARDHDDRDGAQEDHPECAECDEPAPCVTPCRRHRRSVPGRAAARRARGGGGSTGILQPAAVDGRPDGIRRGSDRVCTLPAMTSASTPSAPVRGFTLGEPSGGGGDR
jgi:hypothetical protein